MIILIILSIDHFYFSDANIQEEKNRKEIVKEVKEESSKKNYIDKFIKK